MKNTKVIALLLALTVALLAACQTVAPGSESTAGGAGDDAMANPYAGETIEVIVPWKEGGGTDVWGRMVSPFMQQYLGDDVTLQVINMPGASGVQGANEFAMNREHDGLTLMISSGSNVFPYLFGQDVVQYEFNDFVDVLGSPQGAVVYVSADTGVTNVEELCAAEGLIYGGISAAGLDIVTLVGFDLLELDVKTILGYEGRGPARVALEQGETTIDFQASSAYVKNVMPLVEEGAVTPIYSMGIIDEDGNVARDPQFADLPSLAEAYEICKGEAPSGLALDAYKGVLAAGFAAQKNMWVHGDAPQERIDALLAAAEALLEDAEFQEQAKNLIGDNKFSAGESARTKFNAAAQLSDEAFDWLRTFLKEDFDTDI